MEGHGRTELHKGQRGRGLPAPHRWERGVEAGGGRRSVPPPRSTCRVPAVASLSGAKQTLPAPGAALCPQRQPSPPSPGSPGCGDPTDRLQVLYSPRCPGMVGADVGGALSLPWCTP